MSLTIQALYARDVVPVQGVVGVVALVKGRHECRGHIGMAHAQRVPELVGRHDLQVGALLRVHRPLLVVVEVSVARDGDFSGEVGMSQGAAFEI